MILILLFGIKGCFLWRVLYLYLKVIKVLIDVIGFVLI